VRGRECNSPGLLDPHMPYAIALPPRELHSLEVVNEIIRRGLSAQAPRPAPQEPFQTNTFESPFRAGVDPLRLNQLVDDLDVEPNRERQPR
jgi:hypothetical protein